MKSNGRHLKKSEFSMIDARFTLPSWILTQKNFRGQRKKPLSLKFEWKFNTFLEIKTST